MATFGTQPVHGFGALHALGSHSLVQALAKIGNRAHDRGIIAAGAETGDERAVDLDAIDRQILEQRQA